MRGGLGNWVRNPSIHYDLFNVAVQMFGDYRFQVSGFRCLVSGVWFKKRERLKMHFSIKHHSFFFDLRVLSIHAAFHCHYALSLN